MRLLGICPGFLDFLPNFLMRLLKIFLGCANFIVNLFADFAARFTKPVAHDQQRNANEYKIGDARIRQFS